MTRRAFAALVACLPLSWQVKLGAAPQPVPTLHAERFMAARYAWLHSTFNGQGALLSYLRQQFNTAYRGGLIRPPTEIILGKLAYAQYEREMELNPPLLAASPPPGASIYMFKGVWVFSLAHSVGWDDWHVGILASRHALPKESAQ